MATEAYRPPRDLPSCTTAGGLNEPGPGPPLGRWAGLWRHGSATVPVYGSFLPDWEVMLRRPDHI